MIASMLWTTALALAAGASGSPAPSALAANPAPQEKKIEVLRFSGIPDADKKDLTKQYEVVSRYLSAELGLPVEFINVPDYNGAVTSLAANKIDFAWLGGVTAVQSEERTQGQVAFVAARDTDLRFKSYFIANKGLVDSGVFQPVASLDYGTVENLKALAPKLAKVTFTFGDKLSTSGHFMPRHFLVEAGIDPESSFKGKPGFQLQGGHSATLRAVATGAFDMGVLNYASWDKADEESKKNAPVIAVTPSYVDYCWVAHKRMGAENIERLRAAFLKLDAATPAHEEVLKVFSAASFVEADPKMWDGMRKVMKAAAERGIIQ
jgi:phosphonate transport system substrate-binding protein